MPPTLNQTFTDAAAAGAKLHTFMSMPPGFAGSWMCIFSKERPGGAPFRFAVAGGQRRRRQQQRPSGISSQGIPEQQRNQAQRGTILPLDL